MAQAGHRASGPYISPSPASIRVREKGKSWVCRACSVSPREASSRARSLILPTLSALSRLFPSLGIRTGRSTSASGRLRAKEIDLKHVNTAIERLQVFVIKISANDAAYGITSLQDIFQWCGFAINQDITSVLPSHIDRDISTSTDLPPTRLGSWYPGASIYMAPQRPPRWTRPMCKISPGTRKKSTSHKG